MRLPVAAVTVDSSQAVSVPRADVTRGETASLANDQQWALVAHEKGVFEMATTITTSIVIQRPLEEVFAFVTDARNNRQWQARSGLQRSQQLPDSPVGVGTRIIEVWTFMGIESQSTAEVTEYEPDRTYTRHAISGSSPIKEGTLTFEPVAGGTRLTAIIHVQAGGLFAIAEPLLTSNVKRGFDQIFATLKALLEEQAAASAS
jgi:uncharacterized protein YndB with AHSA1/START domain